MLFTLSPEPMITEKTTKFKLCTRDYITTTMYNSLVHWKTQQWPQDWKRSVFIPISKKVKVKSENEVAQSCLTLCDPMDCSLPGLSVHGVFQARILEWVAISFSRGSSPPRDQTQISCIAGRCFTLWVTREESQCQRMFKLPYNCPCFTC